MTRARRSRYRLPVGPVVAVVDDPRRPGRWYVIRASTGHAFGPPDLTLPRALDRARVIAHSMEAT